MFSTSRRLGVIALLAFAACGAQADANLKPTIIGVHLGSVHSERGFNDFNPGLYASWSNGATAGFYHNSESRLTVYGGWTHHFDVRVLGATPSVFLGLGTGYSRARIVPMIVPSVTWPIGRHLGVRVSYAAKVQKTGAHAVHFSLDYRF